MPRSRAPTLSAVAAAVLADPHLFERRAGSTRPIERLRVIRGVGEWTAQYIALRQLREPDAFPAADLGLLRAMAHQEGRRYSSAELARPGQALAALARLCRAAPLGVGFSGEGDIARLVSNILSPRYRSSFRETSH